MTTDQRKQFDLLIDALWCGEVGEVEFLEVSLDLGASLGRVNQVLEEVRLEDGVLS